MAQISQAEVALAQGRLEEACELLRSADVRSAQRGRELAAATAAALVERGRGHLAAGRLTQAQMDAHNAANVAGHTPDVAELCAAVARAIESTDRRLRRHAQLLEAAKSQIEHGRISLGEKWLAEMSLPHSRASVLMRDIDVKKSTLESAVKSARSALEGDDLGGAIRAIVTARDADASDERVIELGATATKRTRIALSDAVDAGRLDRAEALAKEMTALCGETGDAQQLRHGVEECRAAWNHLHSGQPARAAEILRRVAIIFPTATWIENALEHLKRAEAAMVELRCGPLGLLGAPSPEMRTTASPSPRESGGRAVELPTHGRDAHATGMPANLPARFLLRVDGAGSFCVFRQALVTIGPISSAQQPDLGLLAEPGVPIATIERREDEYFVRGSAVAVNDRPNQNASRMGKLLAAGDRIALSPRCRMTFAMPSAASTTAVLDLTGCRYPRLDVRRIILLDRDIVLGASLASHVRVEGAEESVILHIRGGRLVCESKLPVEVNGAPMDRMSGIPMDAHVRAGSVSFVISAA